MIVRPNKRFSLSKRSTRQSGYTFGKPEAQKRLKEIVGRFAELQHRLYAENSRALLLVFQGMDASGKDSMIRHVTTGLNPAGVRVHSYGVPSPDDLDQSYFQRHWRDLPAQGYIGVHNRSHYEEVVVTRVHPTLLKLRGFDLDSVDDSFWQDRFEDIRSFERHLTRQGHTTILKFFLHVSKEEQLKRLVQRLDDPEKNWKFEMSDVRERLYWDDYQSAYEEAIAATSTEAAPWFVIPADQKRFARICVAEIVVDRLEQMDPHFPDAELNLEEAKHALLRTSEE